MEENVDVTKGYGSGTLFAIVCAGVAVFAIVIVGILVAVRLIACPPACPPTCPTTRMPVLPSPCLRAVHHAIPHLGQPRPAPPRPAPLTLGP